MSRQADIRRVAAKNYWREAEARVVVEAWREEGGSLSSFAGRHGLERARVARWVSRLEARAPDGIRFHPVRVVSPATSAHGSAGIEIQLGEGRLVRVDRGFDVDELRRVLQVLRESGAC